VADPDLHQDDPNIECHAELVSASFTLKPMQNQVVNDFINKVLYLTFPLFRNMTPGIYILSNKYRTTFYIGVTNNVRRRVLEHKSGLGSKFTKRYNLHDLLYYEEFLTMEDAIVREKELKNWHRDWKIKLIKSINPEMNDLSVGWYAEGEIEDFKQSQNYIEK
jgi:putative endonuclease